MNWDWNDIEDGHNEADILVLDIDLIKCSKWKKTLIRKEKKIFQKLKDTIEGLFSKNNGQYRYTWSGDGLIVLVKLLKDDYADELLKKSMKVIEIIRKINKNNEFSKPIPGVRIGITIGNIINNKIIGKIDSETIDIAGHLQKYCPGDSGGILVHNDVYAYVDNRNILKEFIFDEFQAKEQIYKCYYYPYNKLSNKPPIPKEQPTIIVSTEPQHFIGIDIGRTWTRYCVIDGNDENFVVLEHKTVPTNIDGDPKKICSQLAGIISELIVNNNIKGIGIGLPGLVDPINGILKSAPGLFNINNIEFVQKLNENINIPKKIDIKIDNDVRCATRYEWKKNKYKNFVCIFAGNGLGSSIVIDNKILYGATYTAGEIGHTTIFDTKLCELICEKITVDFF